MAENDSKKDPLEMPKSLLSHMTNKRDSLDMGAMDYKSIRATIKNIDELSKVFKGLTGITTNTEASIKNMGDAVSVGTNFAGDKLHKLGDNALKAGNIMGGILLKGLGEFTSALGSASSAILDESQKQAKTWHEFANYGGIGVKGLKDISDQYPRTLLSLEKFQSTITSNANALAMYGGRLSEGADVFSETQTILANASNDLRNLGYSVDDMADATANYMSIQAKTAKQEKARGMELALATKGYVKQQNLM